MGTVIRTRRKTPIWGLICAFTAGFFSLVNRLLKVEYVNFQGKRTNGEIIKLCLQSGFCSGFIKIFTILLILLPGMSWAEYCYFIPPKGWTIANPDAISPRVKIAFVGRSSKGFLPSVNLATEQVNVSLPGYIDAVKKIHEADPNTKWRDLGKFTTPVGEGRLTEIESKTPAGIARLMQLIVVKDKTAYILTTGALKEEFSKYYKEFEKVLGSLQMTNDLTATITSPEKRSALQHLIGELQTNLGKSKESFLTTENPFELASFQRESWEPFQKKVIAEYSEMGAYWQILLLQDTQKKLR